MSKINAEVVKRVLEDAHLARPIGWSIGVFQQNIRYEVFINKINPILENFQGQEAVEEYLSLVQASYQILEPDMRKLVAKGAEVMVYGSELARLTLSGQLVRAEWAASFQFKANLIEKISMSVYRWNILPASSSVAISAQLVDFGVDVV